MKYAAAAAIAARATRRRDVGPKLLRNERYWNTGLGYRFTRVGRSLVRDETQGSVVQQSIREHQNCWTGPCMMGMAANSIPE